MTLILKRWQIECTPVKRQKTSLISEPLPNIHWLITGDGLPLIEGSSKRDHPKGILKKSLIKVVNSYLTRKPIHFQIFLLIMGQEVFNCYLVLAISDNKMQLLEGGQLE